MPRNRKPRIVRRYPAQAILDKYPDLNMKQIAKRFNLEYDRLQRWNVDGYELSEWQADEIAIRGGVHPSEIWSNWFDIPLTADTWRHKETTVGV